MLNTPRACYPEKLWAALFILVPLFYNPLSRWQYEPDKAALTLVLTGLLVGWTLRRGIFAHQPRGAVSWLLGGYLLIRLLTTTRSIAPHWSLWGEPGWRNGLWMTLAGVLLFEVGRRHFSTSEHREHAVTALLIGSGAVAGYGVVQYVLLPPLTGIEFVRVPSTLAHPNLLAAYLALIMPLTAVRLLQPGSHRVWAGLLLILQITCLVFTYSRTGWLAAITGLGTLGTVCLWISERWRSAIVLAGCAVVGLVTLLVLSMLPPLPGEAPHVLQTLTSMFRWQGATAQIRLLGWQAGLAAIRERPWLGFGPATFRVVAEWFMPPRLILFGGVTALGGRPHNVFLEVAVESGLIGLACFLAILGAFLFPPLKLVYKGAPEMRGAKAGLLAALVANLVNYMFSMDTIMTTVLFWVLAGMLHAYPDSHPTPGLKSMRLGWGVVLISISLAGWMIVPDMVAHAGDALASHEMWRAAAHAMGLASKLSPTPEEYRLAQGNAYVTWATISGNATVWQEGLTIYDRLVSQRPNVAEYWQARGLYLRRWASAEDDDLITHQALDSYTHALQLSPTNPDLWLDRGLTWLDAGESGRALADLRQAGELLDTYTRYYGAMAVYATLAEGDPQAAAEWQERANAAQREWDAWVWRR